MATASAIEIKRAADAAASAQMLKEINARLGRIEAQLTTPSITGELISMPAEPLATHTQIEGLSAQMSDITEGLRSLMATTADRFTRIDQHVGLPAPGKPTKS